MNRKDDRPELYVNVNPIQQTKVKTEREEQLSIEGQKLLTEWLGECWHETSLTYDVNDQVDGQTCFKCSLVDSELSRIDFSNWVVIGRLIEKCAISGVEIEVRYNSKLKAWYSAASTEEIYSPHVFGKEKLRMLVGGGLIASFVEPNPQLAVCKAIVAYLQEGEK